MEPRRRRAPTLSSFHPFLFCLLCFALLAPRYLLFVRASSSTLEVVTPPRRETNTMSKHEAADIRIVFSDVDGTLVHYPEESSSENEQAGNRILKLPPSATGMQGIISSRTLEYCRDLRRQNKKLVLISGMRTTTLLKRIPYLPRADAYCSEAGGRIFYPCQAPSETDNTFTPVAFDGATQNDLIPFGITEDLEWRSRMEKPTAAGTEGFPDYRKALGSEPAVPVAKRGGLLWEYARTLQSKGYVLDTNGYSTCFRVNRKQQTTISDEEFDALLSGQVPRPPALGTSTNLGCVDFYPIESGKKHCCEYLAQKFCNSNSDNVLSKHAICFCDDDNDLEMALACNHAFVPGVSSDSMAAVIQANPSQLTATGGPGTDLEGTIATEKALELALQSITST